VNIHRTFLLEFLFVSPRRSLAIFGMRLEDAPPPPAPTRKRSLLRFNCLPAAGPADESVDGCIRTARNSSVVSAIEHRLSGIGRSVPFIGHPMPAHDLAAHSRQRQLETAVGSLGRF